MLIIGENINASNRSVAKAIASKDREFLAGLAIAQATAGADFIDVNAGAGHGPLENQMATMEWLVDVVQAATDKPLVIDSDVPVLIEAALRQYRDALIDRMRHLQATWELQRPLPYFVSAMFDHSTTLIEAELTWVTKFIDQMEIENIQD